MPIEPEMTQSRKTRMSSMHVTIALTLLTLIEMRWLNGAHLTLRDENANPLLDMFDFANAPSADVNLSPLAEAPPPNLATDGNGSCLASAARPVASTP
jgi:hypothetical protein